MCTAQLTLTMRSPVDQRAVLPSLSDQTRPIKSINHQGGEQFWQVWLMFEETGRGAARAKSWGEDERQRGKRPGPTKSLLRPFR